MSLDHSRSSGRWVLPILLCLCLSAFTAGSVETWRPTAPAPDDETLVHCISDRYGGERWMFIADTAHLETLYVSEDLVGELASNADCEVDSEAVDLKFKKGRHTLRFG